MNNTIQYKRITLYGLVQGIGFRPSVARLAMKYGIKGEVNNWGGGVSILASAPAAFLEDFLVELKASPPPLSEILHIKVEDLSADQYKKALTRTEEAREGSFYIVESRQESEAPVMLPPDLPVCEACLAEMEDAENRRYKHLLISCTHCGPRYSIIKKSPYDRIHTTMDAFAFCPQCYEEYTAPESRRFHAQTVSCHHCGPRIQFILREDVLKPGIETKAVSAQSAPIRTWSGEEGFEKAVILLREGHILAVKGIGGYHFIASPYRDGTVKALRELKHREEKAFAVCFSSLEDIKAYSEVSKEEEVLLRSKARPIVLLEAKNHDIPFSPEVCKHSRYMGAFLAYTPILVALCRRLGPLIATSANLSDTPIIHREEDILSYPIAESHQVDGRADITASDAPRPVFAGVLTHEREIVVSQDDSVAWVIQGKPQLIRRARGYTPLPLYIQPFEAHKGPAVLAAGGELKSAFCLQKGPLAYMSQYLGDLERDTSLKLYRENLEHMEDLLKIKPGLLACDLHPDYATTRMAQEMGLPVIKVQHHHAHIASVMAEKGLEGPVIGLSFDGTGYGADGNVWGGEFLICEGGSFTRAACLKPIPLLMGDESMKDCLKTATAYLHAYNLSEAVSDQRYPIIARALEHKVNTLLSSSMGRLFDAVSSILNLCQWNTYEGKAAILLENAAWSALKEGHGDALKTPGFDIIEEKELLRLDAGPYLTALAQEKARGRLTSHRRNQWALAFHRALAQGAVAIVDRLSERTGIKEVVLSGGVFQNKILVQELLARLAEKGYRSHMNAKVPTNDGGICLGQAYVAMKQWQG